jgi:molybdenum cofactor guanylyltransferase
MTAKVSGIVLAGGRSSRFGSDKLGVLVGDRPLLHHAIAAVARAADEVIVVAAAGGSSPDLPAVPIDVRLVHDTIGFAGPLAGLMDGVRAARHSVLLVAGGDMPSLVPEVLRLLAETVGHGAAAAALGGDDPQAPAMPLPIALARDGVLPRIEALLGADRRSLRALLESLPVARIAPEVWHALDPEGRTLRDVDVQADLPPATRAGS